MAKELEKTLRVDDEEYNINAVQADKVVNKLTLKPMNLDGTVETSEKWTIFDGSSEQSLNIVPASGGQFEGQIRVPDLTTAVNDKDVLNYKDIVSKVVNHLLDASTVATWDGETLSFTGSNNSVNAIGVVLGELANLEGFITYNIGQYVNEQCYLCNYIYICRDTGEVYFGDKGITDKDFLTKLADDSSKIEYLKNELEDEHNYIYYSLYHYDMEMNEHSRLTEVEGTLNNIISGRALPEGQTQLAVDKAVNDTEGKPIHLNYYRASYNKQGINSIHISSDTPSGGANGDIWIKIP